jgi:tetratricopeptide (TPR) repeat protein
MPANAAREAERAKADSVVESAKALEKAGDVAGSLALLLQHRGDWARVPPAYAATIGRLSVAVGDSAVAIENLTYALDRRGSDAPAHWRRNLGTAYLREGQIEAAGAEFCAVSAAGITITRRAALAAMDAFRGSGSTEAAPSAFRSLAMAELLVEAGDIAGAYALLQTEYDDWVPVPASYEAALGRLALMQQQWEAAADYLERARALWRDDMPVGLRRALGVSLLAIGQFADAGRALSRAADQGAAIVETAPRLAINAYRKASGTGEQIDTRFGRSQVIIDRERRLVYCSIPKNGCTLLKINMVMNGPEREDYLASGLTVHDYAKKIAAVDWPEGAFTSDDYFRFVVLRDPLRRLLSAYLNRMVRSRKEPDPFDQLQLSRAVRDAQARLGIPYDPERSISFEEFVRYLSTAQDVECDKHWMPQVCLVGSDLSIFAHVGKVERIDETLNILTTRFGFAAERDIAPFSRDGSDHVTHYSDTATLAHPYRALPAELDTHQDAVPMPELFYTPELLELAERRYAADIALYVAAG